MKLQARILKRIKDSVMNLEPEARTILYGSQARGDARPDSDTDILVLLPDRYDGREFVDKKIEISGALYDLSLEEGIDISTLVLVPKVFLARPTPFTLNVIKEGIEL